MKILNTGSTIFGCFPRRSLAARFCVIGNVTVRAFFAVRLFSLVLVGAGWAVKTCAIFYPVLAEIAAGAAGRSSRIRGLCFLAQITFC